MRTIELSFLGLTGSALLIAACSASGDGGGELSGGNGGNGTGGIVAVGGSSASGGTGGTTGGTGGVVIGQGGAISIGGAPMGGMAGLPICQEFSVIPTKQIPTVVLLVDNSSSMFETMPPAWPILYGALMDPTTGVVQALDSEIRFGFAAYKGSATPTMETDAACATWTKVAPNFDNHAAIDTAYSPIDWPIDRPKWETPTSHAINMAVADLVTYMPDPPGPKYILLVTDGNPNTCQVLDPQCGQDLSIKAAQDAYAAGIGLFAMGIGDIVAQPNNGCAASARCGALHLQDLANAGIGAPVQAPPGCEDPADPGCQFKYEQCNQGQTLKATYAADAPDVGVPFSVDTRNADAQAELVSTLTGLLANVISCTVEMDAVVTGNPALGMVTVGGNAVTYDDPDGWVLDLMTRYTVTLQGAACETFKGGAALDIKFPCDPVTMEPIAEPR
jgi:hypothetical protein